MNGGLNKNRDNSDGANPLLTGLLFIISLMMLFLLLRISRLVFLIVLLGMLVATGVIYFYRQRKRKLEMAEFAMSAAGKIQIQLELCEFNVEQLAIEMNDIEANISDMESQLDHAKNARQDTRLESERLIAAFKNELKLRQVKLNFYNSCINKLQALQQNHLLIKELERKQERLKQLKESQYEELAKMEELKSNLEYEERYLDTIETLSLRMLKSQSTDSAEALQLELQQMTDETRDL